MRERKAALVFSLVLLVWVAFGLSCLVAQDPTTFPTVESVSARVDSLESRISALESALAVRNASSSSVAAQSAVQSASVGGFALNPGETLMAVDGVPVGQPTYAPASPVYVAPRRLLPLQSVYDPLPYGQMSVSRSLSLPGIRFQSYRTCGPGGCR